MTTLATITPIDLATGSRVQIRVCSSQDPDATGAAGLAWWPAIEQQPALTLNLFDGDFTSAVEPGASQMSLRLSVLRDASGISSALPNVQRFVWAGAGVWLYRLVDGLPLDLAVMKVQSFAIEADVLTLRLEVDTEPFDADVLFRSYAGTTGAEGGVDLKGRPKPWVFGRARNVEPVLIDQIDSVFQISGYGPVQAISAVYERGGSFGASVGNFADYAALVAATIPPGRWGTCLAQGMFRLGAPPAGVITCDVDGDSTGGFLRRTGAIIGEIARRLGLSEKVNEASLEALDAAVPRDVNIVISEQVSLIDLARRMAAPCNAVGGVGLDGRLMLPRVAIGVPSMTLDAQGRQMPPVVNMARQNTRPPYKRIRIGAARSWRVHSFDEIAFYADLIDRGLYDPAATYREGNIVERIDKSRWVYVNPTPSSGNAPPAWPTASNAFWQSLSPPASEDPAVANDNVALAGLLSARPASGAFLGQLYHATDTSTFFRWDGTDWQMVSDVTVGAVRTILPEFPVIEIKQGEAGNVGTRSVPHTARRGDATITGGTWSIVSTALTGATVTINSSTGVASISGVTISGSYTVRYTHTDAIPTDHEVNVNFVEVTSVVSIIDRTAVDRVSSGTAVATYSLLNTGIVTATNRPDMAWIIPQAGMADYEVRATVVSGTIETGPIGSWQTLSSSRGWSNSRSTVGNTSGLLEIEIRRIGQTLVLTSALISIEAIRQ